MPDRRAFAAALLGAIVAGPMRAGAQRASKVYRIGYVGGNGPTDAEAAPLFQAFFDVLRELGYVQGTNITFEGRYYGFRTERLPVLAAELVALKVDIIVAGGPPAPEAAQRATKTIPIVMTIHPDPVRGGLARSLARPGGNVTGVATALAELPGKRLQILKEALPGLARVDVLIDRQYPPAGTELAVIESAARTLGVGVRLHEVRSPDDFEAVFAAVRKDRPGALMAIGGNTFYSDRTRLLRLAADARIPTVFGARQFAEAGALMTYGVDPVDNWRRAARYVDRILKGAKPADLAIEQAANYELVINLATADALGIAIPQPLMQRANLIR